MENESNEKPPRDPVAAAVAALLSQHFAYEAALDLAPLDMVAAFKEHLKAPPERFVIKLGMGVEIDVTDLPALTLGDRKRLKAVGIDFLKYAREGSMDPEDESKMVLYLLQKKRKDTTAEEADEIPAMVSGSFLRYFMRRSAQVDDPFSTRSIFLRTPTGGPSAMSDVIPSKS